MHEAQGLILSTTKKRKKRKEKWLRKQGFQVHGLWNQKNFSSVSPCSLLQAT
jgi:ribonuclease I